MAIDREAQQAFRRRRLADALTAYGDDKAELGRALGYKSGAFVRQMIDGERPITEKTVAKIEALHGFRDWFSVSTEDRAPMISAAGVEVALIAELAKLPPGAEKTRLARHLLLQVAEAAARLQPASPSPPAPAKRPRKGDPGTSSDRWFFDHVSRAQRFLDHGRSVLEPRRTSRPWRFGSASDSWSARPGYAGPLPLL